MNEQVYYATVTGRNQSINQAGPTLYIHQRHRILVHASAFPSRHRVLSNQASEHGCAMVALVVVCITCYMGTCTAVSQCTPLPECFSFGRRHGAPTALYTAVHVIINQAVRMHSQRGAHVQWALHDTLCILEGEELGRGGSHGGGSSGHVHTSTTTTQLGAQLWEPEGKLMDMVRTNQCALGTVTRFPFS